MGTAELIAAAHGYQKISVIAGVGSQLRQLQHAANVV